MIEIILLAGSISVELEPYAVENQNSESYEQGTNTDADDRPFQWSTRRDKPGNSLFQDANESNGDDVKRDAFGRPIKNEK